MSIMITCKSNHSIVEDKTQEKLCKNFMKPLFRFLNNDEHFFLC